MTDGDGSVECEADTEAAMYEAYGDHGVRKGGWFVEM